jgi:hypothetical protein
MLKEACDKEERTYDSHVIQFNIGALFMVDEQTVASNGERNISFPVASLFHLFLQREIDLTETKKTFPGSVCDCQNSHTLNSGSNTQQIILNLGTPNYLCTYQG